MIMVTLESDKIVNQIPAMLKKLDEMYQQEEEIINKFKDMWRQYQQLKNDEKLLENMIVWERKRMQLRK